MIKKELISNQFISELLTTVESIGVMNTINTLKEARTKNWLILSDFEQMINTISEVTGVSIERIMSGTDRSDERKMAIALCVFYAKKQFKYSYSKLSEIFNKDEGGLFRYNKMVENLPEKPKSEFDKTLKQYNKTISLKIKK